MLTRDVEASEVNETSVVVKIDGSDFSKNTYGGIPVRTARADAGEGFRYIKLVTGSTYRLALTELVTVEERCLVCCGIETVYPTPANVSECPVCHTIFVIAEAI